MSRTTVYRLLALKEPPRYERERRQSLLDPHKAKIAELLALDAEAPATVILDHLRRQGYGGGITILKDYLQKIRCEFLLAQGRQRMTYLPGEIGHGDLVGATARDLWSASAGSARSTVSWRPCRTAPPMPRCSASTSRSLTSWRAASGASNVSAECPTSSWSTTTPRSSSPRRVRQPARLHDEVAALFGHLKCLPVVLDPGKPESKGHELLLVERRALTRSVVGGSWLGTRFLENQCSLIGRGIPDPLYQNVADAKQAGRARRGHA
ncbi:hypothetical protein BH20ACT23_BH20ACT23_02290 [soil metagenome]